MECNPLVLQGSQLPPFYVPPKQLTSWSDRDEMDYKFWLDKGKKHTRDDYRQYLLSLNDEFGMEDAAYVKLEEGLEVFGKIVSCMKQFPHYKLGEDLDKAYIFEGNAIMKEFIKFGVEFVKKHDTDVKKFLSFIQKHKSEESTLLSQQEDSNMVENEKTPVGEAVQLDMTVKASNNSNEFVTPVSAREKRKERNKKTREKRTARLLKFHEKLVVVSGLPPSRLMLQQTPKPGRDLGSLKRRKLDFEVDVLTPNLMPVKEEVPSPKPAVIKPEAVTHPSGTRSNSSYNPNPLLCSSSARQVHCPGAAWKTGTPHWSEARPGSQVTPVYSNQPQLSPTGMSSITPQTLTLCSCPQCCGSWTGMSQPPPTPVLPPQPPPPAGRPAFCGSCLLYGNVYTLTPV